MIVAIVLAEVWRAMSIAGIVVGAAAIPREYLEAGELFEPVCGSACGTSSRRCSSRACKSRSSCTILAFQVFAVVVAIVAGACGLCHLRDLPLVRPGR